MISGRKRNELGGSTTNEHKDSRLALVCYASSLLLLALGHTKIQYVSAFLGTLVTYGKLVPVFISLFFVFVGTISNLLATRVSSIVLTCTFAIATFWGFYYGGANNSVFFILYYAIACRYCSNEVIYKAYTLVVFGVITLTIVLSLIGIIPNDIDYYGRYDLGFTFATFGPNLFLSACLSLIAWKGQETSTWEWAFLLLGNQYLYNRTGTLAVYICVLLLFIFFLLCKHGVFGVHVFGSRTARFFVNNAFFFFAVFTLVMQIIYNLHYETPLMTQLNGILNTRLELGRRNFLVYQQNSSIFQLLFGIGTGAYSYVDSSYEQILFTYGAIALVFVCLLMRIIMEHSLDTDNVYLTISLLIFALHCFSDPQLLSFRCDPFIITVFSCAYERHRATHIQ